jgi:hypothetical protein
MKKYLLAYQISGQTVGIDLNSWSDSDLNGNKAFKIIISGTTIPAGYIDISTMLTWHQYGSQIANDYLVWKTAIKDIVTEKGWANLTNTEKDLAIQYYAYANPVDPVIYLMGKGYTQQQAQYTVLLNWHKHHGNLINACRQRWYYVKFIAPMYLSLTDAEDLLNTIENLVFAYTDTGRLGLNYGDKKNGILDYIESTNAFVGQGLRENNYALLTGTWDIFIQAMKNVFVEGIYTKYEGFELI